MSAAPPVNPVPLADRYPDRRVSLPAGHDLVRLAQHPRDLVIGQPLLHHASLDLAHQAMQRAAPHPQLGLLLAALARVDARGSKPLRPPVQVPARASRQRPLRARRARRDDEGNDENGSGKPSTDLDAPR